MQSTILIDRDRYFIEGLRQVLAQTGQFSVLGVGHEEKAALSLVNVAMPAAVLVGLNVAEQGDPEAFVAALRQRAPQSRLVVFTDDPCEPEQAARRPEMQESLPDCPFSLRPATWSSLLPVFAMAETPVSSLSVPALPAATAR